MEDKQGYYVRSLQILQQIRDVSDGDLNLPQICVVGDQSSGKSATLACITGIEFPVKAGICTKAPIVVECRQDRRLVAPTHEIQDQSSKVYRRVSIGTLNLEIDNAQKEAMENLLACHDNGTSERSKISNQEIRVRVHGPDQPDIVVVDLPGMINAGPGKEATRELIRRYIKERQTLILLVSEAKQDAELTGAIDLAKEFDPRLVRTLRVLTKFDTFDSQDAKETALGLIKAQINSPLGAHAVVCRSMGGDYDAEAESAVLSSVPRKRAGVQALKDRLPPIYADLIRTNLPGLKASAEARLKTAQKNLERIGPEPIDPVAMIRECQSTLIANLSEVEEQLTPSMKVFQEAIHATGKFVTQDWVNSKLSENAFRCPFFQGEDAFLRCLAEITEQWKPHMLVLIDAVQEQLATSMNCVELKAHGVSKTLLGRIQDTWALHCETMVGEFKRVCEAALKEEADFGTMNHYLVDKYAEEMLLPDEFLTDFLDHLKWDDLLEPTKHSNATIKQTEAGPIYEEDGYRKIVPWKKSLKKALNKAKAAWIIRYQHRTLHEHLKQRLFAAVKAAWTVEKKTFTDMVHKKCRDSIVKERERWVLTTLLTERTIREAAVEDADIQAKREQLKGIIAAMKKCLRMLRSIVLKGASVVMEEATAVEKKPVEEEEIGMGGMGGGMDMFGGDEGDSVGDY